MSDLASRERMGGSIAGHAIAIAVGGLALLALAQLELTICPFANLTGHPCPGCGMTRATLALLSGHFGMALRLHPLAMVCLPIAALFLVEATLSRVMPAAVSRRLTALVRVLQLRGSALWWGLAAALLGIWVARFLGALGGPVVIHPIISAL